MAFEGISGKLQAIFRKLTGRGRLSEKDIAEAMREIRLALLEADVNYLVAKDFIKAVSERAVGSEILNSLTPGQQVVSLVNQELTKLMGGTLAKLDYGSRKPSVILMAGLQGAGKTTMCAKLAEYSKRHDNKSPLLAACDVYRPAAIEQLKILGEKAEVPVYDEGAGDPVTIAKNAVAEAKRRFLDTVIIDTAGRLHVDETLMNELVRIRDAVLPAEILLVVDAMTGQEAVNAAKAFNEAAEITGIVLTKLDSDTRGGAALSARAVTGKPIKFAGIGEKIGDIEPFHPDRMASRILGMGDMLSLIEKAQLAFDEQKAAKLTEKIAKNRFTLDDFLDQMEQVKSLGSMQDIINMLPGINTSRLNVAQVDEKALSRTEAIIRSMTREEREEPGILNASRRKRIARGSGTSIQDVNRLINQFQSSKQLMKQMSGGRFKKGRGGLPFGL